MNNFRENLSDVEKINKILRNKKYLYLINAAINTVVNKKVSITFGGDSSYTNGSYINVGVFDFLQNYSERDIMFCIIMTALHESEHVVSTNFKAYTLLFEQYENSIKKEMLKNITNSLEDGRIEIIHKRKFINNIKYFNRGRDIWYMEQPSEGSQISNEDICKLKEKFISELLNIDESLNINEMKEEIDEEIRLKIKILTFKKFLSELLWSITTIATCNQFPISYSFYYSSNDFSNTFWDRYKQRIRDVVENGSCDDVIDLSQEICEFIFENFKEEFQLCEKFEIQLDIKSTSFLSCSEVGIDESDFCNFDLSNINLDAELINEISNQNNVDETPDLFNNSSLNSNINIIYSNVEYFNRSGLDHEVNVIKAQARKLLSRIYDNETTKLKNGRIKTKDLWRTSLGETTIMYKKSLAYKKNLALYLLIDASGSMRENIDINNQKMPRMYLANRTAAVIEEGLSDYINMEIAYFNPSHIIVRSFDSPQNKYYVWSKQMCADGCNTDYENIKIAHDKLLKRKEEKKIIIIVSDGLPCGDSSDGYNAQQLVRAEVISAKKDHIETIAVSLYSDSKLYKNMYDNIISCNSSDLKNKLVSILYNKLRY